MTADREQMKSQGRKGQRKNPEEHLHLQGDKKQQETAQNLTP